MREIRFRRPEFQRRLRRARRFERVAEPVAAKSFWRWAVEKIGFRSRFGRIAAVLLILLIAYFLTLSRVFVIRSAEVQDSKITAEQVRGVLARLTYERVALVPKSHILLLPAPRLLRALQASYPEVRKITEFRKDFPNRLTVRIESREASYVWQSGNDYYAADQDGTVFAKIPGPPPGGLVIADRSAAPVMIGEPITDQRLIPFIEQLRQVWPKQINDVRYASFSIPALGSQDIFVKTETGFQVYFDLGRNPESQLANLNLVLSREIKPETYSGLSYIDLRLPTYAYYCYLDAPCAPENATSTPKL